MSVIGAGVVWRGLAEERHVYLAPSPAARPKAAHSDHRPAPLAAAINGAAPAQGASR
jgi:hypothetical protein